MTMYNQTVIKAAEQIAQAVQDDFFNIATQGAVTLSAVAGAGKSHFVKDTVKKCRRRGIRVAVAAPHQRAGVQPCPIYRGERTRATGCLCACEGR